MTPAQLDTLNDEFEACQRDATLTDTWIQQCGEYLCLRKAGSLGPDGDLAMTRNEQPDEVIVRKFKLWCVKNRYRCSAIQGERILV